jgi:hypothetical protein
MSSTCRDGTCPALLQPIGSATDAPSRHNRRARIRSALNDWCERGDSNPHGLPRQILSLVRLPIPPLSHSLAIGMLMDGSNHNKPAVALRSTGTAPATAAYIKEATIAHSWHRLTSTRCETSAHFFTFHIPEMSRCLQAQAQTCASVGIVIASDLPSTTAQNPPKARDRRSPSPRNWLVGDDL